MRSREEKPSWTSQPPRYAPDHIAAFTIAVVAIVAGIITGAGRDIGEGECQRWISEQCGDDQWPERDE